MITKLVTLTNLDNLLIFSNGAKGVTHFTLTRFVFNNILLLTEFKQGNSLTVTGHFTFTEFNHSGPFNQNSNLLLKISKDKPLVSTSAGLQ